MRCLTMAAHWQVNQRKRGFYYCQEFNVALNTSAFVIQSIRLTAVLTRRSRESQ